MNRLIRSTWVGALAFAALAIGAEASPAAAQDVASGVAVDQYTIMVPELNPLSGGGGGLFGRNSFGSKVAEELRDLISELHTHRTVSRRDMRRAAGEYDLDDEDLYNCVRARQLGMQMGWGLVLCGEYEDLGDRQVQVNARFVGSETGEEFVVPTFTANERDPEAAARTILETFDEWQTQLRHTVFCKQYMDSEDWESALRNCDQALAINPASKSALYMKAYIHREMGNTDTTLETLDALLEVDELHEDALKLAGITATEAGLRDRALDYFDRYMQLNPGDVGVRLTVATDIANAGDPAAAMEFAQEGLEVEPDNLTLHTYIGHFGAQAAGRAESLLNAQRQGTAPPGPAVDSAQIRAYYATAAESYQRVFDEQGSETEPQILERLIIALFKLNRMDEAVELGAQAVELDPENAALWEAYSRALQEAGQPAEALAAVERTEALGKASPSLTQRKALLQLGQGQDEAAVRALVQGVEDGMFEPSAAFNIIFANAYGQKYQRGQLDAAFRLLEAAGPLAVEEKDRLTRNFWRGYILFEQAKVAHEPMTAASAERAKPMFERALELFRAASGYERYHESANVPQFIDQAQRFIEIEEALIKRGR